MAISFNLSPEQFSEQVLLPGLREILRDSIRAKLHAEADKIVEDLLAELPTITLKAIRAMHSYHDEKIEVNLIVERKP